MLGVHPDPRKIHTGPPGAAQPSPSTPVLPCPSQCGGFQPGLSVLILSGGISPPDPAKVTPPSPNSVSPDGLSHLAAQDSNSPPSPASSPHPSLSSACTETGTVTANVYNFWGGMGCSGTHHPAGKKQGWEAAACKVWACACTNIMTGISSVSGFVLGSCTALGSDTHTHPSHPPLRS